MKNKFELNDLVLPLLDLPDPCPVRIEINDGSVFLYVGSRDWQWDQETGKLIGCGVCCCSTQQAAQKSPHQTATTPQCTIA